MSDKISPSEALKIAKYFASIVTVETYEGNTERIRSFEFDMDEGKLIIKTTEIED